MNKSCRLNQLLKDSILYTAINSTIIPQRGKEISKILKFVWIKRVDKNTWVHLNGPQEYPVHRPVALL